MKREIIQKTFANEEEYFEFEERSELKHELYNGNLIKMSGVSVNNNEITLNIAILLKQLLKGTSYRVFVESVKVKTPLGNFFYPDVMVCHPNPKKYYSTKPILLIEVLSASTRKYDLVDKFIQYQKIQTLEYYMCVEPEKQAIYFYKKVDNNEWQEMKTLTQENDLVNLDKLNISFSLKDVYKPE